MASLRPSIRLSRVCAARTPFRPAAEAAALHDLDVEKQARQLGLHGRLHADGRKADRLTRPCLGEMRQVAGGQLKGRVAVRFEPAFWPAAKNVPARGHRQRRDDGLPPGDDAAARRNSVARAGTARQGRQHLRRQRR